MKDITRIIIKLGASALLLVAAVSCNQKNDLRTEKQDMLFSPLGPHLIRKVAAVNGHYTTE